MSFVPLVNHSLKYNKAIDGLRGVAILLVLIFHLWPDYFSFGYVGVDIFFVLSGFLITQIIVTKLSSNSFSFKEFYRNRIRRIFPTMILVVFVALIIGYLFLLPNELANLGSHAKSSLWFFQNFRLIDEIGYWDKAAQLKPFLHFWSLSIEEQFYLLWPFLLFIIYKMRLNLMVTLGFILTCMLFLPYFMEIDNFYHSLSRFWELTFGGLIYLFNSKINDKTIFHKYSLLIYFSFFCSLLLAFDNMEFNLYKTLAIVISTGLLIILLTINSKNKFFASTPLVFLGLISFPLYLWHYVLISYIHILNFEINEFSIFILILSILLSYITYRYVEIYFRKQNSFKFAYILFGIVILLGLISQYVYAKKGLPNRSHFDGKDQLLQQFKKMPQYNKDGRNLIEKILGEIPNNDYIRATSDNLENKFVLIVGDSHAHSSYIGLANEFKKEGIETLLLANSGCAPYTERLIENECKEKITNIRILLEKVESIKNIQDVIFITREPQLKYIKSLFDEFSNKKINLYYLLENPPLDFSPDVCIKRPFNISKSKKVCGIKYEDYLSEQGEYRNFVKRIANDYQNITMLDPVNTFCDKNYCYSIRDNNVLYSDTNHHSVNGSLLQGKEIIEQILESKSNEIIN